MNFGKTQFNPVLSLPPFWAALVCCSPNLAVPMPGASETMREQGLCERPIDCSLLPTQSNQDTAWETGAVSTPSWKDPEVEPDRQNGRSKPGLLQG